MTDEVRTALPLDRVELILRELQALNRRLERIEAAIPVLTALSSGSKADEALRE